MIEINLLPLELRKKTKKVDFKVQIFSKVTLLQVFAVTMGSLFIIHLLLTAVLTLKAMSRARLDRQWQEIKPQKEQIDILKKDMQMMEDKLKTIQQLTTKSKIIWSEKLNIVSDVMPNGVWLRRIFLSGNNLEIEGSAASKRGEEMILVSRFVNNLKKDNRFYLDCQDIAVGSIQRRKIGHIELVDFVINVSLK